MKKLLFILVCILLIGVQCNVAQTKLSSKEEAAKCFEKCEWSKGLKYTPHASINKEEFMDQYHKNKALWDKAFAFLKETNLDTIRPGKYLIDGDNVFASITENPTKDMENSKWEFHKNYIDLQMVIKGTEKMGMTPISKITITDPYNDKKDIGFGTYSEGDYYTVEPGTFLIFSPSYAHRPSLKVEGCDKDKKIVIKIKCN
jgi:biofilm protein TabA